MIYLQKPVALQLGKVRDLSNRPFLVTMPWAVQMDKQVLGCNISKYLQWMFCETVAAIHLHTVAPCAKNV